MQHLTPRSSGHPTAYRGLPLNATLDCGIQMQAVRASSSSRQIKQRIPHTSRSVKSSTSLVKHRGESRPCFSQSVVGASRPRAAPRSQWLLGAVGQLRLSQRTWPLSLVPRSAMPLPMRRKVRLVFHRRWCMLRRMPNSTRSVAAASVLRRLVGVKSPVAHLASGPQPNHSVKRTAPGVPWSAACLKR
jgi:hypothetical protein